MKTLLVDDDQTVLDSVRKILMLSGHEVRLAHDGVEALQALSSEKFDLVVTDVRMPRMGGMELIEKVSVLRSKPEFLVMTAYAEIDQAVWAMKLGAVDFLQKPFKLADFKKALDLVQKRKPESERQSPDEGYQWYGSSPGAHKLRSQISLAAQSDANVLILGESGSGKEFVAKMIHQAPEWRDKPFVAINCAAIPESLLESELFGHERGAFSGAHQSKKGLIEAADGGILYLDELGDLPLSLQPKLLRFLEDREVRKVGGIASKKVKVKILSSTSRPLPQWVKEGRFRSDLWYRLEVLRIELPPLRDRKDDLKEWFEAVLENVSRRHGRSKPEFSTEVYEMLTRYSWPGNLRELSNLFERALALGAQDVLQLSDFPEHLRDPNRLQKKETQLSGKTLKEVEDELIRNALQESEGDRSRAAKLLGINERTIYRWLQKERRFESNNLQDEVES